jgi:hypothetical protein
VESRRSRSDERARRQIRLGEKDLELLWFLAEHRMALPDHVAALLGTRVATAKARLAKLAKAGYVRCEDLFRKQPAMYLIAPEGLKVLGSTLPPPRRDVHAYRHDAGVAWLWLAARHGTFGPLRDLVGERRMRSHDAARDADSEPLAVRLGGAGPRGGEKLHYPDLLLTTTDGRRIALELELSGKGRSRLEKILAGYAAEPRIDGVVYLVEHWAVARSVEDTARRLGISSLVHVQRVKSTVSSPAAVPARAATRAAAHTSAHAHAASHRPDRGPSEATR